MKLILFIAVLLVMLGFTPTFAAAVIGEPAPALIFPQIDTARFDLAALRGRVVVVNFWATWCSPCREEMPALDAFYVKYHGKALDLIGISADRTRDRDEVIKVAQSVHYPVALLGDGEANGFGKPQVLPITYVIDSSGTVRFVLTPENGAITLETLEQTVLPLLSAKP